MKHVTVEVAGPLTLIQDTGRPGYAHLGVTRSGAFDCQALRLANRLVGNPQDSAALEALGGGLELTAGHRVTVAVSGAHGQVFIDDRPRDTHTPLHVEPGARIRLGTPRHGLRYYVAFAGGIDATPVLGSRSYDTLGRIGPAPLEAGQRLSIGPKHADPTIDHAATAHTVEDFEIMPGPDATGALLERLIAGHWDLDPQSNRIGVRLQGVPIEVTKVSLRSRPMVLGAVQLPPNGLPIILGPDHPATGGYPVIAVVLRRSLDHVAQWSGGLRRFALRR